MQKKYGPLSFVIFFNYTFDCPVLITILNNYDGNVSKLLYLEICFAYILFHQSQDVVAKRQGLIVTQHNAECFLPIPI